MVARLVWEDYVRCCYPCGKGIWGKACGWQTGASSTGKHTLFLLNLFSSKPHLLFFPSVSLRLALAPVQRPLVLLFPPCHFSVLLIFNVFFSLRLYTFFFLYLLLSAVSFSFTSTDLPTYSTAVSSLFTFHLPILTLLHAFWGFFSFVCLMLFLFWHCVCPNPCCNPLSAKKLLSHHSWFSPVKNNPK